jgi:inosine-uridine nucleoside N-ribohydrolase
MPQRNTPLYNRYTWRSLRFRSVQIVFDSGVEVAMVPLEVTHTALATPAVCSEIKALGTPFANMLLDIIHFFTVHPRLLASYRRPTPPSHTGGAGPSFQETYQKIFGFASPPVHDVCAVALVAQPHLFTTQLMRVDVGTSHPPTLHRPACAPVGHTLTLTSRCDVCAGLQCDAIDSGLCV